MKERLEELLVVCGLYAESGATPLVGIWWQDDGNILAVWKALVDSVGIKDADLEDKFLF